MSSIPVVRRTTARTTRPVKGTENANSKGTRVVMHGKTAGGTTTAVTATSRLTAPTVASKAKAVASEADSKVSKRKREALAEVTAVNKGKSGSKNQDGKEVASSKPRTGAAQRVVVQRAAAPAPRVSKTVNDVTATKKTKDIQKPVRVPKVYRDEAPVRVEQAKKREAEDDEDDLRASKRRHTETLQREDASQEEVDHVAEALAEPEPQLWDDLDADDWDDPLMCSEYVKEVCEYWKKVERETLPNSNYMDLQTEVTWDHRGILIDWVLQIHARFNMLSESLFLTVNLIDRFLGKRLTTLPKLQLVGLACFFVATKFEETCAPSVTEIVRLCDNQYSVEEVLRAERYILQTLDWDLRDPGPMSWLRRGSKADSCCTTARTLAKYLLEIGCIERRLVGVLPSHMAAASLWLARLAVGRVEWDATLEHYTTFPEKEIIPVATVMLEYIITNPIQHESLYKKYAHKRYMKCSQYMRQWALERWPENTDIFLERDLGRVKDEIRRHHAEEEEELTRQRREAIPNGTI